MRTALQYQQRHAFGSTGPGLPAQQRGARSSAAAPAYDLYEHHFLLRLERPEDTLQAAAHAAGASAEPGAATGRAEPRRKALLAAGASAVLGEAANRGGRALPAGLTEALGPGVRAGRREATARTHVQLSGTVALRRESVRRGSEVITVTAAGAALAPDTSAIAAGAAQRRMQQEWEGNAQDYFFSESERLAGFGSGVMSQHLDRLKREMFKSYATKRSEFRNE
jgi:hypothetical protein